VPAGCGAAHGPFTNLFFGTDVQNEESFMLIKLPRSKQLNMSYDMYSLFFMGKRHDDTVKALPTQVPDSNL